MKYFIRLCQGSSYPGACESPLTKTLHAACRPTHSVSAICTSRALSSTERPFINIRGRQCINLTGHCLCCPWKKKKIHESQLCFNSNRRLVPSMGPPVWRWGWRMVGRSGDKTSVCKNRQGEIEWRVLLRPLSMTQRNTETAMYVYVRTHILIQTDTHIPPSWNL